MNPAEMLALAAIGYRGCELNLSQPHRRKLVADEITRYLDSFRPVQGKWTLLWGPAGYRPGIAGLDTSAMYVAESKTSPSTIAIIIRGTNFFSLRDWASNLLIEPKVWSYSPPGADIKVSLGVWRGLKILQALKSESYSPLPPESALEKIQAAVALYQARLEYAILKRILSSTLRYNVTGLLARIINNHLKRRLRRRQIAVANDVHAQFAAPQASTLLAFLRDLISRAANPVEIYIVGHSKGGALAAALALWLADTQGNDAGSGGWDLGSRARLHVYTFAAPTPGNREFANHFQQKLKNVYRLANPYDIVPHVWDPEEISQISDIYGNQLQDLKARAGMIAALLRTFDYQHEVIAQPWLPDLLTQRALPLQIAYNHLDAYLNRLGIFDAQTLSFLALFAPLGG